MNWNGDLPNRILFVDVETTGLSAEDRIVSFAGILVDTSDVKTANFDLKWAYFICDPGKKSHPRAEEIHGYSDWILRHQEPFSENASVVLDLFKYADLICAHNIEFDLDFISRELESCGLSIPNKPEFCTMKAYRQSHYGSSALGAIAKHIGLARSGIRHSAMEDAWLSMMIYLWLNDYPKRFPFSVFGNCEPANLKPVPMAQEGPVPRRKRVRPLIK